MFESHIFIVVVTVLVALFAYIRTKRKETEEEALSIPIFVVHLDDNEDVVLTILTNPDYEKTYYQQSSFNIAALIQLAIDTIGTLKVTKPDQFQALSHKTEKWLQAHDKVKEIYQKEDAFVLITERVIQALEESPSYYCKLVEDHPQWSTLKKRPDFK